MTALAHAGHWIGGVAAAIPVIAIAVWIGLTTLADRRRRRRRTGRTGA
jgi:hypothetical protein